jgi:hypothetical protein
MVEGIIDLPHWQPTKALIAIWLKMNEQPYNRMGTPETKLWNLEPWLIMIAQHRPGE